MSVSWVEHADSRVRVTLPSVTLDGDLVAPEGAMGAVIFAHGSGSSRHSPRNQYVARQLQQARMATLLFDLLTADEELLDRESARLRFDIPLLASRLVGATDWLRANPAMQGLKFGYFGASTGGGAALVAAAYRPNDIGAVVSRGGRPDMAGRYLSQVQAPTLLIVGGDDAPVIDMNQQAIEQLACEAAMEVIPGATHLFEEPGALERVAQLASEWFARHLGRKAPRDR